MNIENARLPTLSDELTRLYHRHEFRRLLAAQVEAVRLQDGPIAVVLFDVDGMRAINSQHGRQAGDAVLLAFADLLRRDIRSQDIAARYGADEFAVMLPAGTLEAARAVSVRLCHAMAHHEFQFDAAGAHGCAPLHFTMSAGAVAAGGGQNPLPSNADQLLGRADEALFEAKQAGPGQMRFWEAHVAHPPAPARGSGPLTQVRHILEQVHHSDDSDWR